MITSPRIEERLAQAYSLTLGVVAEKVREILPAELAERIQEATDARNFLAHRFWFEKAHLMFNDENIRQLLSELHEYTQLFDCLDRQISEWSRKRRRDLGITDELIMEGIKAIKEGEPWEPLPDKQAVKELTKLKKHCCLARVWEFTEEKGRKPLVFELADGSFWQLSDIGLGWTSYNAVGSNWIEHPRIKPYLPANILPRPPISAPWNYEFILAKGVVMWVKPGSLKRTFKWGLRMPVSIG